MRLTRKTPAGLESPNTRGAGYRYHQHIDWSSELEREDIAFGASHWTSQLIEDMRARHISYLEKHYPELVFRKVSGRKRKYGWLAPLGHEYKVELADHWWVVADWRTV